MDAAIICKIYQFRANVKKIKETNAGSVQNFKEVVHFPDGANALLMEASNSDGVIQYACSILKL